MVHLRLKDVIRTTKRSLQRFHMLTRHRHGSPPGENNPDTINVRVFLAAFMIAHRPTHVFESMGTAERSLHQAARTLLASFEGIAAAVDRCESFAAVPVDVTEGFQHFLYEYLRLFTAWKVPDEAKLTSRIKHALVALYEAEGHLPPDESPDSQLRVEFRTQIERLREKLSQIAGPAALAAFDELRSQFQPCRSVKPSSSGVATISGCMTNEQLAHELLLDPFFKLEDPDQESESCVFRRIRESFHRAFWDSLADDLRLDEPCYTRVLRVLSEVRDGLREVANGSLTGLIDGAIDIDFITTRVGLGALPWSDVKDLVGGVVGVMKRLQAPARDADMTARWRTVGARILGATPDVQPQVLCSTLEFLLDYVNLLRIDAANTRLRLISPIIKEHGIEYERGKFQDKLANGVLTLERTTAWIDRALKRSSCVEILPDVVAGKADAFVRVHSVAMLSLVVDSEPLNENTVPETLLFDTARLSLMRREFERAVNGSSALVYASQYILAGPTAPSIAQRQVIADLTKLIVAGDSCDLDMPALIVSLDHLLDDATLLMDTPRRLRLHENLKNGLKPQDPVRRLIASRVSDLLEEFMRPGSTVSNEDAQFVAQARALVPGIRASADKLSALARINRSIHTDTYNMAISAAATRI